MKPLAIQEPQIDSRLIQRGVVVHYREDALWRLIRAQWFDVKQSQGRHHIYVEALGETGERVQNVPFKVTWPSGSEIKYTKAGSGFEAGNYPMSPSRNEYAVSIATAEPSDSVSGIGMGADLGSGFNAGEHTSTLLTFQRQIQSPTSSNSPLWVTAPAGLNLRSSPGGELILAIPYASSVVPTGTGKGGWLPVNYQGKTGWVSALYLSYNKPISPVDTWKRSREFVRRWEGGFQKIYNDSGNWTTGIVGKGELKGTKYGISAASYPNLDIENLTMEQADTIFFQDYWLASGANRLTWPACLLVFDTAVLHGVGTAKRWLEEVGPNPLLFASKRLSVYVFSTNWPNWGKAWTKRVIELLQEAS